ncbi:MAG: hypothetical protein AAFV88_00455 [Planctomycetota bacterium]
MSKQSKNRLTVRGVMKKGRVELLDDVEIANGTLLDIVVVETPEESRLKTAKKKREVSPKPLRFCFVGKKQLTDDPLLFLKRMSNSTVSNVQFENYRATCHVIPSDLQCALATYMLGLRPPSEKVAKAFRAAIRQRTRFEFNPNTRKAQKLVDEIREKLDQVEEDSEDAIGLWHSAIHPITADAKTINQTLKELFVFGPQLAVWAAEQKKSVGATEAGKIERASKEKMTRDLQVMVLDQLKKAAIRSRRKNSGTSETDKLVRKELSEIAKRLDEAKPIK